MKKIMLEIWKRLGYDSRTVWGKYMKLIVPCVMAIIIVMDVVIYAIISSYTRDTSEYNSQRTVELLADDISEVFHRYLGDLNMVRHYYVTCQYNTEVFLDFATRFTTNHYNHYSYIRLILPDGHSYTTKKGDDGYNVKAGRPYKQLVVENMDISVNIAHPSSFSDSLVYSISLPVLAANDSVIAIIAAVFPAEVIDNKLKTAEAYDKSEFLALIDEENYIRVCRDSIYNLNMAKVMEMGYKDLEQRVEYSRRSAVSGKKTSGCWTYHNNDGKEIMLHYSMIPDTPWYVALSIPQNIISKDVTLILWLLLLTSLIATVVLLICIRYITSKVVIRPLEAINRFSEDFAHGKLYSTETRNINSKDELGTVRHNIEKMQDRLISVVGGIHGTSSELMQWSRDATEAVQNIDRDVQVQNIAVENIACSVEQVNASVRLNADDASRTKTNSEDIAKVIVSLTKATDDTFHFMQDIVQKVKFINEITSHTDLLAINASVEASRAGEHGKGFAVVAAEIRKLSEHCHRASTEINTLSEASLAAMSETVTLVGNIAPKIRDNAEMVSRIADACSKQLKFTGSITEAIKQLTESSQNNSISADKMTIYANGLVSDVEKLNKLVDFFKLDMELDKQRSHIAAEIEVCTADILRLKSKLISLVGEDDSEIRSIEARIDEAVQAARETAENYHTSQDR
ncbi:MAG: methyl-accepting chemotaxis protein [Bacteroidales bacterium]|nr:methyl-accepting chemotaxis protein [Bacteroidales bacterium]